MYSNATKAARVQQFQANFLRKMAKADEIGQGIGPSIDEIGQGIGPSIDKAVKDKQWRDRLARREFLRMLDPVTGPIISQIYEPDYQKMMEETRIAWQSEEEAAAAAVAKRERIKQVLKAYAPYVGGGLALGSILGGLVGSRYNNTLAGGLLGGLAGAGLAGAGKYAYDKYRQSQEPTGPVAVG